jgi:U3 small nucleolar ribonucleoprotein component
VSLSKDPNESEDENRSLSEDDSDESESEELSEVAESFAEHSADDEEIVAGGVALSDMDID